MSKALPVFFFDRPPWYRQPKLFWYMLLVGVLIRLPNLAQPLLDTASLSQTQTAAMTQTLMAGKNLDWNGTATWMGESQAKMAKEFPLYPCLAAGLHALTGNLDVSGKLVSILLWAVSFLLLQGIWRRVLREEEMAWANLLYLVAPVSVYLGQAFLPDMLSQCLAFGFLLLALRYQETGDWAPYCGMVACGLLALLVNPVPVAHLGLVVIFLLVHREGWRLLRNARHAGALALIAAALAGWMGYLNRVNAMNFPEWQPAAMLRAALGSARDHVNLREIFPLLVFLGLLVVTLGGLWWVARGVPEAWKRRRRPLVWAWLGGTGLYLLVWAGAPGRSQPSYYLPILPPMCLLFGMGCRAFMEQATVDNFKRQRWIVLAAVVLTAAPVYALVFHQDRQLAKLSAWLQKNTAPTDLVLVRIGHRADLSRSLHNSAVAYYSQRRIWCWVPELSLARQKRALETASWAVVTHLPGRLDLVEKASRWPEREGIVQEDMSWLESTGAFRRCYDGPGFTIFQRVSRL